MLRAWVEGKNHHTWGIFIDALKEVGRMDVANDILQKLQGMNICMHVHAYIRTYVYVCTYAFYILINKYPYGKDMNPKYVLYNCYYFLIH